GEHGLAFGRRPELRRALGDPLLELIVERLKLAGLAIEIDEYLHLGAQNLRYYGYRNIVDRAHFIAANGVGFAQVNRRDEDDGGLAEARMLTDHGGKLKPVEIGHAHIHENDGHVHFQELIESLAPRGGLEKIFAELPQDHLVAQKLRRLIINEKNVDL